MMVYIRTEAKQISRSFLDVDPMQPRAP